MKSYVIYLNAGYCGTDSYEIGEFGSAEEAEAYANEQLYEYVESYSNVWYDDDGEDYDDQFAEAVESAEANVWEADKADIENYA